MSAVYALYRDGQAAQRAVNALRSAGVDDREITVITSEPMEHFEFGEMNKETRIWYIASLGGLVGMLAGTWFTRMTELAWPLPTGNMPIVSWWPNLIVIFELTMLGAILATVITLVVTARLGRGSTIYDPAVSDGLILVGVEDGSEARLRDLESALGAVPGEIKTI